MDWSNLPEPGVIRIFSFLSFSERCKASTVCIRWYESFLSPSVWERTLLTFREPQDERLTEYVTRWGHLIKHLSVDVDQFDSQNREAACKVLRCLSKLRQRRLNSFTMTFIGVNPMFYSGAEFVECFKELFVVGDRPQFVSLDLSNVKFSINEDVMNIIAENNPGIEKLNIQCDALICKVSPDCMKRTIQRCRNLRDVRLISCSLTEDVFKLFTEDGRGQLQHLSLMVRREQKFAVPISSECWSVVRAHLPGLRVSLGFDSTCPMDVIALVLKPEIPVYRIKLAVYAPVEDSMFYIPVYYKETVETLILHPMANQKFYTALEFVAKECRNLRTLLVYCVLPKDLIERILEMCPEMKARGTYILKSEAEPESKWVMEKDANKSLSQK
ncbi:F-box/LRR-repeat protein 8-like [Liolophura sinensis]|uniref:F-box/LRR-repeat protein 8-like n=1 Tax=Liolophura sinensis TaxID=3198878 RepID=UPI0031587A6A